MLIRPEIIQKVPHDEIGTVLVPFIEASSCCYPRILHIKSFGVVRKRDVLNLPQAGASDFNKRLDESMQRKVTLLTFVPEPKSAFPLRIVSVNDVESTQLQKKNGSLSLEFYEHDGTKYLYGTCSLSAVHLKGTMVSCWAVREGQSKQSIPFDFVC